MYAGVLRLLKAGYPWKIKGNDGYTATLVDIQPLVDGEYCAIYRYPCGDCCHSLWEIEKYFTVIEQNAPVEN